MAGEAGPAFFPWFFHGHSPRRGVLADPSRGHPGSTDALIADPSRGIGQRVVLQPKPDQSKHRLGRLLDGAMRLGEVDGQRLGQEREPEVDVVKRVGHDGKHALAVASANDPVDHRQGESDAEAFGDHIRGEAVDP